jgi:hypothetical protein
LLINADTMEAAANMNNDTKNRTRRTWYRSDSDAQNTGAMPEAKVNHAVVNVMAVLDAFRSVVMLGIPTCS